MFCAISFLHLNLLQLNSNNLTDYNPGIQQREIFRNKFHMNLKQAGALYSFFISSAVWQAFSCANI